MLSIYDSGAPGTQRYCFTRRLSTSLLTGSPSKCSNTRSYTARLTHGANSSQAQSGRLSRLVGQGVEQVG